MLAAYLMFFQTMTFFLFCVKQKSDFLKTLLVTMFNLMQTMLHRMQKCFVSFAYSYALHKMNDLGLVRITSYISASVPH